MSNTLYLLGAGASAASKFKLPVMKGFFESKSPITANLEAYIKKYFNHVSRKDINIEELITHLEISLEKYKYSNSEPHSICQKELLNYITERLHIPEMDPCKYHRSLYKKINPETDSVLTLNYDYVFEQSIYFQDKYAINQGGFLGRSFRLLGYSHYVMAGVNSFDRAEYQKGYYIKLHGSVDWLYCPNNVCLNHQSFQPYPLWDEKTERYRKLPAEPCDICGSPLQRVIVMPTMRKSFDNYPKLGFLWEMAFSKLKEANKIVLIGTSLAISDYYLIWLIRESSAGKKDLQITVVNKSEEVVTKTKQLASAKEILWYKDFRT